MTADEPMSTPDSGGRKYRDRSNHDVHLTGESIPCFCWATSGHRLGEEVRTRPEPVPSTDSADDATVGEHEPTHIYVYGSDGQPEVATVCDECSEDWPCTSATPPADDANRAPVSGGLGEGERLAAVERERDEWKRLHDQQHAARDSWIETARQMEEQRDGARQVYAELHEEWGREVNHCERSIARAEAAEAERDTARREAGERIALAIEAAIAGHREAGNRQAVAAMAPLPDLIRKQVRADALTSDDGSGA